MEHAIMCPQCNAPLTPHRFARSIVCSYCGTTVRLEESSISAAKFHQAFLAWNSPESYQIQSRVSISDHHWSLEEHLAHGDISDVYSGRRARWPTERVLLKFLRDSDDVDLFDNEWQSLQLLQQSAAPGADLFTRLIPQPIAHGTVSDGSFTGKQVSVFRWAGGFRHNFEEVMRVHPQGIPPRASIWVWRRILEVLSFVHASGLVHGAVLPAHLLIQDNEHGVRLVGYSAAGSPGAKMRPMPDKYRAFYPEIEKSRSKLSAQLDLTMSARCVIAILGGDPATVSLPATVPTLLADLLHRIALSKSDSSEGAWSIREQLGDIAEAEFGRAQFIPIEMPS